MTEAEWLVCEVPSAMLLFVKGHRKMPKRVKQRRQRLFAVACCRRLFTAPADERPLNCIDVAERVADENVMPEELRKAEVDANALWLEKAGDGAAFACNQLFWKDLNGLHVSTTSISAVFERQKREANEPFEPLEGHREGACPTEERAQCELIRCIFGNPFRPVSVDPSWLTSTVLALAEGIYADRAFDRLPILADALEDAGCDHADILAHCRGDGPHARGCWVIDLVLGRE